MSDERRSIVDSNCIWLLVATNNIVIDCEPRATLAFHPCGVSKSVVIHVITWITRVVTIKRQTRVGHGCYPQFWAREHGPSLHSIGCTPALSVTITN